MKTTNHFQKSSVKLPKLVNNPLDAFPTKGEIIKRSFLFEPPAAPVPEENSWLVPDVIPDASVNHLVYANFILYLINAINY